VNGPCTRGRLTCELCERHLGEPTARLHDSNVPTQKPHQRFFGGIRVIVNPYMPPGEQAMLLCSQAFYDDLITKVPLAESKLDTIVSELERLTGQVPK
jgi:hypothetical protein